ncbi:MAG TPA: hypothetical protein PLP17_14085, partial [Oligoflexia bacterium]|nr:hypothetical protein [Oligoflexia bacterium]
MFRRKASLFGIVCAAVVLCLSAPAAAQTKAEILRKLAFFDAEARTFYFLDENGLVRDAVPVDIASGTGELKPVAGDWDGDGLDSVGVYNCRTQTFYLTGKGAVPPVQFVGGRESCWPLAGDWDGDGRDGIALYDQKKGAFYVKNDLSRGSADLVFKVENAPAWVEPLSGHWTLLPNDGVGFRNPDSALMVLFSEAKQGSSSVFFGLRFTGQLLSSDFNSDARDEIGAFKARGAQGQVT